MFTPLEVIIAIVTILFAWLAVELKNLLQAIVSFLAMSILLAVIFYLAGAPYAAFFQLVIYAGAIVVLLLVALNTVKKW